MTVYVGNIQGYANESTSEERLESMLLLAAKAGDAVAFARLSDPHSKRILHKLYRIVGTWEDAEDVLQEALLKAFLKLSDFEGRCKFSTWLTRIAINSGLMLLRRRRRCSEVPIETSPEDSDARGIWEIPDQSFSPEEQLASRERQEILQRAVLRLPWRIRDVVDLYHGQERSMDEVAETLGISAGAAKSRLMRARIALRRYLAHSMRIPRPNCELSTSPRRKTHCAAGSFPGVRYADDRPGSPRSESPR